MLNYDEVIHRAGSQSNPSRVYEVRLRNDDQRHVWLSCNCKSWTTGPYQASKPVWERYCKHTDEALVLAIQSIRDTIQGFFPKGHVFDILCASRLATALNNLGSERPREERTVSVSSKSILSNRRLR